MKARIQTTRRWTVTRVVTLGLALIPVLIFALIVIVLVLVSIPAVAQYGFAAIFSTKISTVFSGQFTAGEVGLLPAIVGTFLVAGVALLISFPIALAMAVFAGEFSPGPLGRALETILTLFAGIPPIIYALLSLFVAQQFMQPKFSGEGLPEDVIRSLPGLPPFTPGMLPREQSVLLGSIMLSLLVIPFIAPIMLDAIRSVPHDMKEASLALGANRWYTLRRIVLPSASSGITTGVSLGLLKVIGDVIIVAWAIGFVKSGLPDPLWDIFEPVAPLTSTGAGLLNGFEAARGTNLSGGSVSYFAGLLLLIMAFTILGVANWLQKRLARRYIQ